MDFSAQRRLTSGSGGDAGHGPSAPFWRLQQPEYDSDYADMYINGALDHPFALPASASSRAVVGRADMAVRALIGCGVDLILSGHHHVTHTASSAERYEIDGHPSLLVQAGTATSTRRRGELNSCNVIRIERSRIVIEWLAWNPDALTFGSEAVASFIKGKTGWVNADKCA